MTGQTIEDTARTFDLDQDPATEQVVAVREGGQTTAVTGQPGDAPVLNALLALAKDPTLNIDVFDRLIALQERTEDRQAERAFNEAFVRMQARLPRVKRDGRLEYPKEKDKPFGEKYLVTKFAKWETIDEAIRPVYTDEGFGLSFKIMPRTTEGGGLLIAAVLRHEDGHKDIGEPMPVPLDTSGGKNNVQAYGSALSYGKRYAAFAALNIVTEGEDDDGVAAGGSPVSFDEAAQIKSLVDEAGIDNGLEGDERKAVIIEWFNDMLGYALPKGYASIKQEDGVRIRRALLSLKAKRLTSRQKEVQI